MKRYDDFVLLCSFLNAHSIDVTMELFDLSQEAWSDLVCIADEWSDTRETYRLAEPDMPEEEQAQVEQQKLQEAELEQEQLLYHSSGYTPRSKP